jgi:hypothetical protein
MRISFATMIASWLLVCAAWRLWPASAMVASIGALGLTAIWVAHIAARSTRVVRSELPENYSRRLAIRTAVAALAGAALVSVVATKAHADGLSNCGGWGGGPESGCKPCPNNCYRQNDECGCARCDSCCHGGNEC